MYHTSILGIILDTLKWTSSKKSTGHQKPYASLRSCAYKTLSLWCSTMKHGSRCEIIADSVIEEIIFDIAPFENAFTLKVLSGAKKHMSKKARRQLHKAQNEQSNLVQTHSNSSDSQAKKQLLSDEGNQKLCIAALQCLRNVFLSTGCFMKPTVVKSTHLKIIGICLALSNATFKKEQLYNNYLCRLEVYNVLYTLIISPHHLCPPPTQMTMNLLQTAQIEDSNVKVRQTCSMLLFNIEKIIHPQKESLIFPPDVREIKNAFQKFGKEKLLTEDPMLDEDDDDDDDDEEDEVDGSLNVNENQTNLIEDEEMLDMENLSAPIASETMGEKSNIISANNKPLTISVDLTSDENFAKDSSIHLDSSNDSVEYIPQKQQPQLNGQSIIEDHLEMPKSPEMNLRVEEDEDDEDDIQEVPVTENLPENANKVNDKNVNDEDEPSSPKKPRLELENEAIDSNQEGEKQQDENEVSFEDIAATFVDELN